MRRSVQSASFVAIYDHLTRSAEAKELGHERLVFVQHFQRLTSSNQSRSALVSEPILPRRSLSFERARKSPPPCSLFLPSDCRCR